MRFWKLGVADWVDTAALLIVASSLIVGFYEVSAQLGDIVQLLERSVVQPQRFGAGLFVYAISMDIWTPGLPVSMLPAWLQWVESFYWFSDGYLCHFSIWTCIGALIFCAVSTWLVLHIMDWTFWWFGFLVAVATFALGWWLITFLAWHTMTWGGAMIGLTGEEVRSIWSSAVEATSPPLLQYFFLLSIPLGAFIVGKHIGGKLV